MHAPPEQPVTEDRTAPALPGWLDDGGLLNRWVPSFAPTVRRTWVHAFPQGSARPSWGDLWAVLLLAASTIHLVAHDGGRPQDASIFAESLLTRYSGIVVVLALSVPVLITSLRELERDRPVLRWVLLGWSVGPLIALATAGIRDGWVRSLAPLAVAVPVFLAARRIWRTPWGPSVLGAILVAAGLRAWFHGLLLWTSSGNTRHWPLLSWHNQTATVLGACLLLGLAIAWYGRRWGRLTGTLLAVVAASGLWLAASRGAFILTLVGLILLLWLAFRSAHLLRAIVVTALVVVLAVPVVLAVAEARVGAPTSAEQDVAAEGPGSERALLDRGTDVDNLTMRFDYWRGALAMFASAPLTGTGPGSFAYAAPPHLEPGFYPTLSTHNEYFEVLGTLGLVGAIPVWGATFGVAWLVIAALRGRRDSDRGVPDPATSRQAPARFAGRSASVGVLTLLGSHAGMDLDWLWPLLLSVAAIAAGVLHADFGWRGSSGQGRSAIAVIVGAVALSVVAGAGAAVQRTGAASWDLPLAVGQVIGAVESDDLDEADLWLATAKRWNPEAADVAAASALVDYRRGEASADSLAEAIEPRGVRFPLQARIATILLEDDEVATAQEVHGRLSATLAEAHGSQAGRQATHLLALRLAERSGGCEAVREEWHELRDRLIDEGIEPEVLEGRWSNEDGGRCPLW